MGLRVQAMVCESSGCGINCVFFLVFVVLKENQANIEADAKIVLRMLKQRNDGHYLYSYNCNFQLHLPHICNFFSPSNSNESIQTIMSWNVRRERILCIEWRFSWYFGY